MYFCSSCFNNVFLIFFYLHDQQHLTTLRHPGKPLPDGWSKHVDDEGREKYVHDVKGFESWILEDDPDLPAELSKELKKQNWET